MEVDAREVERRVAALERAPRPAGDREAALLLRAVSCLDLTTLAGDDTPATVRALCAAAREPVPVPVLEALGRTAAPLRVAAVCVYPAFVETAVEALDGSGIPVASVAGGFPAGQTPLAQRVDEVRAAVAAGAREIDVVIRRTHALTGSWGALRDELVRFRAACEGVRMKTILATGELGSLENVARAAAVALAAGTDFLKTSTGMERVNATFPAGLVMLRAIRNHRARTGKEAGFKPAGGIRTSDDARHWLTLAREELGEPWSRPGRFRIGASSLLEALNARLASLSGVAEG